MADDETFSIALINIAPLNTLLISSSSSSYAVNCEHIVSHAECALNSKLHKKSINEHQLLLSSNLTSLQLHALTCDNKISSSLCKKRRIENRLIDFCNFYRCVSSVNEKFSLYSFFMANTFDSISHLSWAIPIAFHTQWEKFLFLDEFYILLTMGRWGGYGHGDYEALRILWLFFATEGFFTMIFSIFIHRNNW